MNAIRFRFCTLLAVLIVASGCVRIIPRAPLPASQGWKSLRGQDPRHLDPAVVKDYHEYIQRLPRRERIQVTESSIHLFENVNGQHAVLFEIGRPGFFAETIWAYVLVYDASNKRIEVIKFKTRRSLS